VYATRHKKAASYFISRLVKQTSFNSDDLASEALSLLFHLHFVTLHVAQLPLDAFTQLVQLLRLLLEMVHLILLRLATSDHG